MMTQEDVQIRIERHIDLGEPLAEDVLAYIENHPESRDYLENMRMVADALGDIQAEPPPTMVNQVMLHIERRERALSLSPSQLLWNFITAPFKDLWVFIASFQPDKVLWREFWPATIATCAVVLGVFVSPQVQANKGNLIGESLSSKVVTFTDETYSRAELVAEQAEKFVNGLIQSASQQFQDALEPKGKKDATLKYLPSESRTFTQDTAKAA